MKKNKFVQKIPRSILLGFFFLLFFLILATIYETLTTTQLPDTSTPVRFYSNQTRDDLKLIYDRQIESAKESILIMIYSLKERRLVSMLNRKSQEGIQITVICDRAASDNAERLLHPNIKIHKPNLKGLMHLKILVVDKASIIVGSANLTNDSLRLHGNLITALYSPPMGAYIHEKALQMIGIGNSYLPSTKTFTVGNQTVDLFFLPRNHKALDKLKFLIRSAKKSIKIAMFTWTRLDIAKTVIDASKRGVKVEVVIDGHSSIGASSKVMAYLKENGISVKSSRGEGLLHHKMMIVDDRILVNGSTNWTKAAFNDNDDCFMVFYDLNEDQQSKIQDLWHVISNETESN